ncbi:protein SRG1, partial [Morus notabilis]
MEYGSSLLVPSVQELVKEPIITVPSRYIRPDQYDKTSNKIISVSEIPVINFQNLLCHGELSESELASFHSACRDWGFFQLINHGISSSLVEKIKTDIQDFFNLPMEEKKKLWQHSGEVEGFGQAFVKSEEQKLDWNDIFFLTTLPVSLRKPHLFPKLPTPFRDNLETCALELKNLAKAIISQMEKALEIKGKEMTRMFEDGMQAMRMNYYPPCPQPEQVMGLTPHSDSVGLTILLQISEVEGLQIKKDGMWVPVKPLPNAFIVNIGDIVE